MRIMFAAGGTAGHINPALAILSYLKFKCSVKALFVMTKKDLDRKMISCSEHEVATIDAVGFDRKNPIKNFFLLKKIVNSIFESRKLIKDFQPDIVVGTGGYVSGPVILSAKQMKIPTLIHESNAFAGLTTKILSRIADVTCLGFDKTEERIIGKNIQITGNPIRPSLLETKPDLAKKKLNLDERPVILSFGGSLGASKFNRTVLDFIINNDHRKYQFLISVGKNNNFDEFKSYVENSGIILCENSHVRIYEYINNMDLAMNAADLVISRSGAVTVSELISLNKPSILVPSPIVTHNHQEYNANILTEIGGAEMILDSEFTEKRLRECVFRMIMFENLYKMSENINRLEKKDALQTISAIIFALTRK